MSIEDKVHHMFYDPMENGINMVNAQEKFRKMGVDGIHDMRKTISETRQILSNPKSNPYQQLLQYRKLVPKLLKMLESDLEDYDVLHRQLERFSETSYDNANKRWDKEDDEMLINAICEEKASMYEISTRFGRSPSAITTRVSYLVGIKRLSQEIAGQFVGTLNGNDVSGDIKGTLNKSK